MSKIDVVVGGEFGSEGKGHVTAQLVDKRIRSGKPVLNVRVAGPNAGHTVIDDAGNSFALRQVPVGAAVSDKVINYIGPGSEIELGVLLNEIEQLREAGHAVKLSVSAHATILDARHHAEEARQDISGRIGSTGKGIGAARVDRIRRTAQRVIDVPAFVNALDNLGVKVVDRPGEQPWIIQWAEQVDTHIIIEGTQGYGLGLHTHFYPTVTSSDTRAVDFLAMAGLSPWHMGVAQIDVWITTRVFPIRVAGASGPLENEKSWEELGLPEERTTVTKKVRRVGDWDPGLVKDAVEANGGGALPLGSYNDDFPKRIFPVRVMIALTMVDQKFPWVKHAEDLRAVVKNKVATAEEVRDFADWVKQVEHETGALVGAITTSPDTIIWRAN